MSDKASKESQYSFVPPSSAQACFGGVTSKEFRQSKFVEPRTTRAIHGYRKQRISPRIQTRSLENQRFQVLNFQ